MCFLCLQDFEFELPVEPKLEQKKKRLLGVKSLLQLASSMSMLADLTGTPCEQKVEALKEEQYKLSREF
jgi:hypothetical protein